MPDPIDDKPRCFGSHTELYAHYHDTEWGVPVRDDKLLFEMLILEGAHAGLSWETILKKREGYRAVFHDFDVERVAAMSDADLDAALQNPAIVRHRQKVPGTRKNARIFIEMQEECGSFSKWLWDHVDGTPIRGNWATKSDIPAVTPLAELAFDGRQQVIVVIVEAVGGHRNIGVASHPEDRVVDDLDPGEQAIQVG